MGIGKHSTKEWSRIQKEAWKRRREREAQANAQPLHDRITKLERYISSDTAVDSRLETLEKAITRQARVHAGFQARLDRLDLNVRGQALFQPAQPEPEAPRDGRYDALIAIAAIIRDKLYQGTAFGVLDYDALKKALADLQA